MRSGKPGTRDDGTVGKRVDDRGRDVRVAGLLRR